MPRSSLETVSLRKDYPGTRALDDVSIRFEGGEVHLLIGKNGAGKSTLVKIFSGAIPPTSGSVLINGVPATFSSPRDALRQGAPKRPARGDAQVGGIMRVTAQGQHRTGVDEG